MKEKINQIENLDQLQALYSAVFGKNGTMTAQLKQMATLDNDARAELNAQNTQLREAFKLRQEFLENAETMRDLEKQKQDPLAKIDRKACILSPGQMHPLSYTLAEISGILTALGYNVLRGPEIEDDWHNFTALNTPQYHPARDMQDTFFLEGGNVLRSQTSAIQIRAMEEKGVPIKMCGVGATYRKDMDATHTPMFHQIEGLWIDENITLSDLVGDLKNFLETFFGREFNLRIRPSYFPFTEPSIELDIEWSSGKWLEIAGAGMVHPNVLKNVNVDPAKYQGFAFGFGLDRLAMLKYNLTDLRKFYEGDIRWLQNSGF